MKSISTIDFSEKKALIRVDFNVPLNDAFEVTDDTRIRAAVPTIKHILDVGGAVVLMSHLGRPKQADDIATSLKHIIPTIEKYLDVSVQYAGDCVGEKAFQASRNLKAGEVLLLENLRWHNGEKSGDKDFAAKLSKHGDVYVNDAFGTAHRAHASTAIITQFFQDNKCFGLLLESEIINIDKVLKSAEKPVTAIIGGAKVSSKLSIITNLLEKVDHLIIGGGMAYTFTKAMGGKVGQSLVESDQIENALAILKSAEEKGVKIHLPNDTLIADKFNNDANTSVVDINQIPDDWMGLDIGKETTERFSNLIKESKTVLWNGPMGVFEMETFQNGTKAMALALVEATQYGCFSLVGGGDSVAAINKYNLADQVSYVSTGGGAMLEYLEGKTLPGIAAILQ